MASFQRHDRPIEEDLLISEYVVKDHFITAPSVAPALYLASTPIGNLGDITIRVLEHLAGCDLIACEDTRVTAKLLRYYAIKKKTVSYNEYNAEVSGMKLLKDIKAGKSVVLVSDAGTPIVSDPGLRLVAAAREQGVDVIPLPGASAPLSALVASGLKADTWTFAGFLPTKQGARLSKLEGMSGMDSTLIFFESPNRVAKSLSDMVTVFGGDRIACVARELTKLHEEFATATLRELSESFSDRNVKGEVVILVSPPETSVAMDTDSLLLELLASMSVSKAAAEAAQLIGQSKRELYQRALALKESLDD